MAGHARTIGVLTPCSDDDDDDDDALKEGLNGVVAFTVNG